jgi:hypothetical protein
VTPEQLLAVLQKQDQERAGTRDERLEAMISERAKGPVSVNLAPMAAFADSLAGTDITKGVAAQQAEAQAANKRTEELWDMLNTKQDGSSDRLALGMLQNQAKQADINERQSKGQTQKAFETLAEKVSKINDTAIDAYSQADRMEAAFRTKDPREVSAAMNELARVVQGVKGTMAEGDVGRSFFEDYATIIAKSLTKIGVDGKLSDEAIAPVLSQLGRFRSSLDATTKNKLNRISTTYVGNPAYSEAIGQLKTGGAFDYYKSNVAPTPSAPGGVVGGATASTTQAPAPSGQGLMGIDWAAKAAAKKAKQ